MLATGTFEIIFEKFYLLYGLNYVALVVSIMQEFKTLSLSGIVVIVADIVLELSFRAIYENFSIELKFE